MNAQRPEFMKLSASVRRSPFFEATLRYGATRYSVYNHMYFPGYTGSLEECYWSLVNDAVLSDVGVQRQVEVSGPDAQRFVQLLTPRNLSSFSVGQCKYVLLTTTEGGIINDPVLLRLESDKYWFSTANADVLLWVKGVQTFAGLNVAVREPDVSPVQLQGPKSRAIMQALFGGSFDDLKYYRHRSAELEGIPLIVSRTGYTGELGYEIYLRDGSKGDQLWDLIMKAGQPFGLRADTTSSIRRIEAGILAYQADMTIENNPFEVGLEHLVNLDDSFDFIGKAALQQIRAAGPRRVSCGLEILGPPLDERNDRLWPVHAGNEMVGQVTSCIYSPRLGKNIAIALVDPRYAALGTHLLLHAPIGQRSVTVVPKPFFDPQKTLARDG